MVGWEPDDARVSRPVLRAAEGEVPSVYSPKMFVISAFVKYEETLPVMVKKGRVFFIKTIQPFATASEQNSDQILLHENL